MKKTFKSILISFLNDLVYNFKINNQENERSPSYFQEYNKYKIPSYKSTKDLRNVSFGLFLDT